MWNQLSQQTVCCHMLKMSLKDQFKEDGEWNWCKFLCSAERNATIVIYSLVQSGKRLVGIQFPFAPQTHIDASKGWAKSDLLLQKGEQNVPNIQSSQAFAPPLGGGKSLHPFAVRVKKSWTLIYCYCSFTFFVTGCFREYISTLVFSFVRNTKNRWWSFRSS